MRSIVSPEDQSVTFVELFFDLVFVFSVTQVVGLLHHGLDWSAVGRAVLVFWLVWWAWTQFTWALNAADTTHPIVELGTLLATGVAFFMAVALPDAFGNGAIWFALPYVFVRMIGLGLYYWVAREDCAQRTAVRTFGIVSLGGLLSVLVGAGLGGMAQLVLWAAAIGLDVIAAWIGARLEGWKLHAHHFAERHGLFVIIALGETLIVAAGGLVGGQWTGERLGAGVLAVTITGGLWWLYFARTKSVLDQSLIRATGSRQSRLARDAYSLAHFPMLCGVVAYAAATEEALAHPAEPLHLESRLALSLGLLLFAGGMALPMWRGPKKLLTSRLGLSGVMAIVITAFAGPSSILSLGLMGGTVIVIAVAEERSLSSEACATIDLGARR